MVGRDGIAQLQQNPSAVDVLDRFRIHLHSVKERCLAHIGRSIVPGEAATFRSRQGLPALITSKHVRVILRVHVAVDGLVDSPLHLVGIGPDVAQEHVVAVLILTQGLRLKIEVHGPGQGVGHDQRRRSQVVHLNVG